MRDGMKCSFNVRFFLFSIVIAALLLFHPTALSLPLEANTHHSHLTSIDAQKIATSSLHPSSISTPHHDQQHHPQLHHRHQQHHQSQDHYPQIKRYTILGERNSGTNFLESIIKSHFHLNITWDFGFKHFFGWNDYNRNSSSIWNSLVRMPVGANFTSTKDTNATNDVLFIGIVRAPVQWIGSMHAKPYYLPKTDSYLSFVSNEFYSTYSDVEGAWNGKEILSDHHIYLNRRYIDIFESRATKCAYLLDDIPKKVKNYILVRFEELYDPEKAQLLFHSIAKIIWNTSYPDVGNSSHIASLLKSKGSSKVTVNTYTPPDDVLKYIKQKINRTIEEKLGYHISDSEVPPIESFVYVRQNPT